MKQSHIPGRFRNRRTTGSGSKPTLSPVTVRQWLLAFICLVVAGFATTYAREPQAPLSTINITINDIKIEVEVASSAQQRSRGLSYRKYLASDAGMLFVYQESGQLVFTMRETSIPLSIAFVSEDLVINEIFKMEPWAKENYPAKLPARYALEVNQGWFERNGIKAGDRLTISRQ